MYGRECASLDRILRRFRRSVIGTEHLAFRLPRIHPVNEVLAPELARRHVHEMFDMDGREHGLLGTIGAPVLTLDAPALAALNDQSPNRFVGKDHTVMRLNEPRERLRQFSRSPFGEGTTVALLVEWR